MVGRHLDLPILSWYRQYYPNLKSFSVINKIIEEKGFGIGTYDLDRQYNADVKHEV